MSWFLCKTITAVRVYCKCKIHYVDGEVIYHGLFIVRCCSQINEVEDFNLSVIQSKDNVIKNFLKSSFSTVARAICRLYIAKTLFKCLDATVVRTLAKIFI